MKQEDKLVLFQNVHLPAISRSIAEDDLEPLQQLPIEFAAPTVAHQPENPESTAGKGALYIAKSTQYRLETPS